MPTTETEIAAAALTIDLEAIAANYRLLRRAAGGAMVAGVVKADAYGLGAARVVPVLAREGCADFFVAHLGEAATIAPLVPAGARLFVLNGLVPGAEAACLRLGAIPVLNALDQIERWAALANATGARLPAALQVDSGMSRLGLSPGEAASLIEEPDRLRAVRPVLVMSHLACADTPGDPANASQRRRFEAFAAAFPGARRSLANSGGLFMEGFAGDLVRPGISLYGGAPHSDAPNPMRPVVALRARVIQVRAIDAGQGVGYGLAWTAPRPSRVATIGVGYADGWPRALGNRGSAYIGRLRVPIVGRVSMDSLTLDVTDLPEGALADPFPVELLGPCQTIDEVARDADTISYEILTRLGGRFARTYLPAGRAAEGLAA